MNKFNTIEDFFSYALNKAQTIEQRIAVRFIQEGYMLPAHLEKLIWEDIDLVKKKFWSVNYLDRFSVPMSTVLEQEIKIHNMYSNKDELFFKEIDELHSLIQQLGSALEENPILLEQFNELFIELPPSYRESCIPPKQLMHRVSGNDNGVHFFLNGKKITPKFLFFMNKYSSFQQEQLLDWGCGCGRTAIHIIHDESINYTGCDIDEEAIVWCNSHLGNHFYLIDITPPTSFENQAFTSIVGISVMTHLDEKSQQMWLEEMHRLLKPEGLLMLSVHGEVAAKRDGLEKELTNNNFYDALTDNALAGIAPENYYRSTFQTKAYTYENWATHFDIIDYCEAGVLEHQDLVIMRKKN